MLRWARSWQALAGVLLVAALLLTLLARDVQKRDHARTLQEMVQAAALISELAIEAQLPDGNYAQLSYPDRLAITRGVQHLKEEGQLVGLHLWDADGRLLYSDTGDTDPLSAAELAEVRGVLGGSASVEFEHEQQRGKPTVTVLIEPDNNARNAPSGVVAEILLPQDAAVAAMRSSTQRLYAAVVALLLLVTAALFVLRRRVRRREHEATHDSLTGLGNRARLHSVGQHALRQATLHPEDGLVALLLLDLDGFKTVNDTLGHALGDELLVQVGDALRRSVRPQDLVTRMGGDEFAILLRRADVAMYQAKRQGGGVVVYDEADDPHDEAHLSLLAQLRGAIDAGQMRLHYQPRVNLREGNTVGLEALVRWQHPQRGLLYPDAFIPLAERTALMKPLTSWVLGEAARMVGQWRRAGWPVSVAVNIPPRALLEGDLCREVLQVLAAHDLPGEALELEITETAVMTDPVRAAETLRELRAAGVAVAIDDFGAGYTSLSYLKTLPVRSLKIDRGFVTDLIDSAQDEAVARSVVALGHDLGLTVVAEGVETEEVRQRLRELGCDEVQGYLLSRPMASDLVESWLLGAATAQREAAEQGLRSALPVPRQVPDPAGTTPAG